MAKLAPQDTSFSNLFVTIEYEEGIEIYDIWDVYEVIAEYSGKARYFQTYMIPPGQRIDLLSYTMYGTPSLWWFIYLFNDVVDPYEALYPNATTGEAKSYRFVRSEYLPEILFAIRNAKIAKTKLLDSQN